LPNWAGIHSVILTDKPEKSEKSEQARDMLTGTTRAQHNEVFWRICPNRTVIVTAAHGYTRTMSRKRSSEVDDLQAQVRQLQERIEADVDALVTTVNGLRDRLRPEQATKTAQNWLVSWFRTDSGAPKPERVALASAALLALVARAFRSGR
jgi:hypothetical protein